MRRTLVVVLVLAFAGLAWAGTAEAGADNQNCDDFPNREAAQAHYDQDPSAPVRSGKASA